MKKPKPARKTGTDWKTYQSAGVSFSHQVNTKWWKHECKDYSWRIDCPESCWPSPSRLLMVDHTTNRRLA